MLAFELPATAYSNCCNQNYSRKPPEKKQKTARVELHLQSQHWPSKALFWEYLRALAFDIYGNIAASRKQSRRVESSPGGNHNPGS
jgi:hypothetical protein